MKRLLPFCLILLAACSSRGPAPTPAGPAPVRTAPDSFLVTLTTSKGDVIVMAHRSWSPLAVDRFYELVKGSVWNDARIFRVVPRFVAQFGLTGDSAKDNLWRSRTVPDEPVRVPNKRGTMSFARGGPGTRTLQVFINLGDNTNLDAMYTGGVTGYPPFAEVRSGMNIVDRFESKYEDRPTMAQGEISMYGWAWLDARYPGLDRILTTFVTKEWR